MDNDRIEYISLDAQFPNISVHKIERIHIYQTSKEELNILKEGGSPVYQNIQFAAVTTAIPSVITLVSMCAEKKINYLFDIHLCVLTAAITAGIVARCLGKGKKSLSNEVYKQIIDRNKEADKADPV